METNFELIFNNLPVLYLVLTSDFKIVTANPSYLIATNTKLEEIVGKDLFHVFPDNPADSFADSVVTVRNSFQKVIDTKKFDKMPVIRYDIFISEKNEFEKRYWQPMNYPALDAEGNLKYVICKVEDVTEEVAQTEDNKLLQEMNEELEVYAYVVSHDLQDPLRIMNAYLKLLEKHIVVCDESTEYLKIINDSNAKMKNIVMNLLSYSRKMASVFDPKEVDLNDVCKQVIFEFDNSIKSIQATIECCKLPVVFGDKVQIGQIFQNLIKNAIKYRCHERTLSITITHTEDEKEHTIGIQDNGIGIDHENIKKLFVLFSRITKDEKGTGLGLVICKKVVERHGGQIWVESVLGEGSTFYFTFLKNLVPSQ